MNGKLLASFVRNHFPLCFARLGSNRWRLFVMDNEPSLVSKVAKLALQEIDAEVHSTFTKQLKTIHCILRLDPF